jgi:hypothetical protein
LLARLSAGGEQDLWKEISHFDRLWKNALLVRSIDLAPIRGNAASNELVVKWSRYVVVEPQKNEKLYVAKIINPYSAKKLAHLIMRRNYLRTYSLMYQARSLWKQKTL